jgi:hypothetical protein
MGLLLGALAGGAQAFNEIADDHIKQWNEKDMLSLREQMDMAKEKRIEEAQVRAGTRQEEAQIRAEDRGLLNRDKERKSEFDFETNPENVKRATDAELYGLRSKDDYKYSRGGDEADYRGAIARATDIDHTDYAGRALDHELKRKALEGGGVSAKISEVDEYQLKSWSKEVETLDEAINSGMLQDEALLKAQVRLKNVRDNINNTLAKYQEGGTATGGDLQDPLGLRQAPDDSKERERLLKEIEATGATIESLDNTDTEGLKAVLNDARRSKIDDKLNSYKGKSDSAEPTIKRDDTARRNQVIKQIKDLLGPNTDIPESYSIKELQLFLRSKMDARKPERRKGFLARE